MDSRILVRGVQRLALEEWSQLVAKCLANRLDIETFESFVPFYQSKQPLPPSAIADLFLRPQPTNQHTLDPRIPQYIQSLFKLRYVDVASILKALYKYSTSHARAPAAQAQAQENDQEAKEEKPKEVRRWLSSYAAEEVILYSLTKAVAQGTAIRSPGDALEICKVMSKWMQLFTAVDAIFESEVAANVMGSLEHPGLDRASRASLEAAAVDRAEMESARAAFGALLLRVFENPAVLQILEKPIATETRTALSESLANFVPTIRDTSQIAARLELFRADTLPGFEPVDKMKQAAEAEMEELLDSAVGLDSFAIPEMIIANSRAGLYIYLNAALVGRPLVDDSVIFNYLQNRYHGDVQTTTIDLILASFDVLANAVFRNEGQTAAHLLRSYLINKLPLLLSTLATSMYPPLTPEFCITEALSQVDTNAFPTLSSMFDDTKNSNTFTDSVREDFCFACCLHGLVQESSIETLLGEIAYRTLPDGGRYVKDDLVQQCLSDPARMQGLIGELENMDGNVGAVCQALTEVLGHLCRSKETMSLKLLCSQLAGKPLSLDVMLLFEKPYSILHPLCELLDNWKYEDDQNEYQPVYEEFGSILLLLLAFTRRYNLCAADLGVRSPGSFVVKLLGRGHLSQPLDEIPSQESEHLGGWIRGLYDSETGGLDDDLMSSCPPQDFYLLIPTLFHQTVLAYSTGHLTEENLKSGVEYLVETFLLPSLITAITFLANQLWVDRPNDQKAIIRILQLILLPTSISNDAQTMLASVLNIIAKPLEHSLRAFQRREPKSQDVEPLLRALKDSIPLSRRTGGADHNELEAWTSTPGGGLASALRHTLQGFVQWSMHPGINVMPTSYTHRQILVALRLLTAKRVLSTLLEELKLHADLPSSSIMYDITTALICAPDVTNDPQPPAILDESGNVPAPVQRRLTLREALKHLAGECRKVQKADPGMAEVMVRLHRRVEAQMAVSQAEAILHGDLSLGLDAGATESIGDAMAAAAATASGQGDVMIVDNMDLTMGGADMSLGGSSGVGGSLDLGADADLFGGLSGGMGIDWGDTIDLT